MTEQAKTLQEIADDLGQTMQCNCDLNNWQPDVRTGHSHVCRIHKIAMTRSQNQD